MAGLLIKELVARGDLERCLIVCPGSLAEQWQDELYRRFQLPFEILTNDKLEAARTGNWFLKTDLVIARLDKLSRNEDVQQKLQAPEADWDLVVCDEAHKLSATFFGGEMAEIETLKTLEKLALGVRRGGRDTKWRELAGLFSDIFTTAGLSGRLGEPKIPYGAGEIPRHRASPRQKLVLFTEHRDTLRYLRERITTLLGREESVVVIHGSVGREERRRKRSPRSMLSLNARNRPGSTGSWSRRPRRTPSPTSSPNTSERSATPVWH